MSTPIDRIARKVRASREATAQQKTCEHDWEPVEQFDWMGAEYDKCASCGLKMMRVSESL